ncbi:FadR/GntR family transcriptional regulator [Psychromarinibacter sp. S121]|uniref:FadR/GntR family transcriptional regulator n=1 Tax=Psychromarinibacter sp. S121 TaxID=3415127 RepID=UPI003C7975FC
MRETARDSGAGAGPRLEEQIYQSLLERIQSGTYGLGQRLPSEMELSSEFGVSRPVVRAALARLRDAGLVTSRRGAGSFVSSGDSDSEGGFTPIGSIDDMTAFFDYRRMIETRTAALAAGRASPEQVADLRRRLTQMDKDIEAGVATVEQDVNFHIRIAEIAGNRFLLETLHMLRPHTMFMGHFLRRLTASGYARGKAGMRNEHYGIVDAIEAGDSKAAERAMDQHLAASRERIFKGV